MPNITSQIENRYKIFYTISVVLFGINPIFIRFAGIPSEMVALIRAFLGLCTLAIMTIFLKRKIDTKSIKKYFPLIVFSGVCLCVNWIFLFASYVIMKVSVASLFNYMAPIIAVAISAIILKKHLSLEQILCVCAAFIGIVLVSGVLDFSEATGISYKGVFMGIMAAISFVGCIFCNRALKEVHLIDSVMIQLLVCNVILLFYVYFKNGSLFFPSDPVAISMLLFMGIVSSGFAYLLYYGSMPHISVQSIAILGYLEPVVCIFVSLIVFKEPLSVFGAIGAVMIIGATIFSELNSKNPERGGN